MLEVFEAFLARQYKQRRIGWAMMLGLASGNPRLLLVDSGGQKSAVYYDALAGDEGCGVAGQEDARAD